MKQNYLRKDLKQNGLANQKNEYPRLAVSMYGKINVLCACCKFCNWAQ